MHRDHLLLLAVAAVAVVFVVTRSSAGAKPQVTGQTAGWSGGAPAPGRGATTPAQPGSTASLTPLQPSGGQLAQVQQITGIANQVLTGIGSISAWFGSSDDDGTGISSLFG